MDRTERQTLGIDKWIKNKCIGTCLYPTGFGKTTTAFKAIQRFLSKNPNRKVLVVVPTDYLKDQWTEQSIHLNLFNNVTVKVINTVVKSNWSVDLLVLDEIHVMAADTFFKVFQKVKYKLVLGLTGTIDRLDGKEELLIDKCPIIDSITMEDAISYGWLSPYVEYQVLIEADNYNEYQEAHKAFMSNFAKFNFDFNLAMQCVSGERKGTTLVRKAHQVQYDLAKSLCTIPPSNPLYNDAVRTIFAEVKSSAYAWNNALKTRKEFVMNHPKKLEVARKILDARPNSKSITFSATIKNAEDIGRGYVLHSKKTKKKRGIIKEDFDKLTEGVLNTSKALDCGADIPGLNLGIILCNSSSSIQKRQRLGRIIRFSPDKKAELFTLVMKGTMEENWFKSSSKRMNYITINEDQLEQVLNYKPINKEGDFNLDFSL